MTKLVKYFIFLYHAEVVHQGTVRSEGDVRNRPRLSGKPCNDKGNLGTAGCVGCLSGADTEQAEKGRSRTEREGSRWRISPHKRPWQSHHRRSILKELEGPVAITSCLDPEEGCSRVEGCVTHLLWRSLGAKIEAFLETITLRDLLEKEPLLKGTGLDDTLYRFGVA